MPTSVDALVKRIRDLSIRIRNLERLEGGTTNLTNNTGGFVSPGDIVVIDPSADSSICMALAAGAQAPTVIIIGGDNEDLVKCAKRGYGKVTVTCEGAAISPGDAIVTSATNTRGQVDNTATARNLLGFALESKAAGAVADIIILV